MKIMPKKIAVIGAGGSGLTAIKCCLEEDLDVVCFEKTNSIGGLWRYREEDVDGIGSVMKSTIINTNKELNAFSDFPPPEEFPVFMHNSLMIRYLESYAKQFDLLPHVKLQKEVLRVQPHSDFETTGKWLITVRDICDGSVWKEVFDGVMICTGHHAIPQIPTFPDQHKFEGKIMHSHAYKKPAEFEDKIVVVVGIGSSAADVASELSSICKQVYLSSRRSCWVVPRTSVCGTPTDSKYIRRVFTMASKFVPLKISSYLIEREANRHFDHSLFNMKPEHYGRAQHPTINDALPSKIMSGSVKVKKIINRFTPKGVIFDEDEQEYKADVVIMATGYKITFPFLDEDIFSVKDNRVELFKLMFVPHLRHQTLAMIGLIQVIGSIFPLSEAQSRLFALVMNGKVHLPPKKMMLQDIKNRIEAISKQYYDSFRHTIQVDWFEYMDEIADLSGTKPNLLKMALTDPILFYHCFFGPGCAYQYRLEGPHRWDGAREAIVNLNKRFAAPFRSATPAIHLLNSVQ